MDRCENKKIDKSAFVRVTTTSPSAQLTGMWYSEGGDILLTQVGDSVASRWPVCGCGRIAGELAGGRLTSHGGRRASSFMKESISRYG
jgi:hypothetical protein